MKVLVWAEVYPVTGLNTRPLYIIAFLIPPVLNPRHFVHSQPVKMQHMCKFLAYRGRSLIGKYVKSRFYPVK